MISALPNASSGLYVAFFGVNRDVSPLPLTGATAPGVRYRLQAAAASEGDDAPSSWCLRLRYTGAIVIDGDEFINGINTCGEAPAPRVSGVIQIDCSQRVVFVFGGAHETVEGLELASEPTGSVRACLGLSGCCDGIARM
jgi:hypothetical protein